MNKYKLRCITCKKEYEPKPERYVCDDCGRIQGTLEVLYDYEAIKESPRVQNKDLSKKASMYQFDFLLPVKSKNKFDEYIGGTPLFKFELLGLEDVLVKYDGCNPSSSYKDRASSIAINKAIDLGKDTIFCASTGNAASSLAVLSAHTDLQTYIFVPGVMPLGKRTQLEISGADVFAIVNMNYDEVYDFSLDLGLKKGWYCRHAAINPYLLEGKKTGAYEIIVQNDYQIPDYVLVGVGDGTVISSLYKGFWEFKKIGLINTIPKIVGVQAGGMSAVKNVFEKGKPYTPHHISGNTVADSISVGNPRDVIKACTYIDACDGFFITLTDKEILDSVKELGNKTGIFAEPAGAVPFGGLKKLIYEQKIKETDTVCLVVTGNGLKDVDSVKNTISTKLFSVSEIQERFEK